MRKIGIIAVLSLMALALAAVPALAAVTTNIDPAQAPRGTHLQTGTIGCAVQSDGLTVLCSGYELAGVGHTNATATLTANYAATVDCFNPGTNPQNPIESHQTTFTDVSSTGPIPSDKNGRLTVPSLDASPTAAELDAATTCPNANWEAVIRPGTLTLTSFTYTLSFAGFGGNYITITGP